ncbi:MAG: type II secretion system protein [Fimbriimonadales bacterium]
MKRRQAFTMVELLTVIAIIAILAAIAFPAFARAKDGAYRGQDISNMNALRNALQLYKVDQGGYPPAVLGYVTLYTSGPNAGQVVPATSVKGYIYPKRLDSLDVLRPSYVRFGKTDVTTAFWPNKDPRNNAPYLDLNGDGVVDANDDNPCARQAYDRNTIVQRRDPANPNNFINSEFYRISGYDVAEVPLAGGGTMNELRYALFWTSWGLGVNGCSLGNGNDDPRQLGYFDPPDTTIVTWNSNFRDWDRALAVPQRTQKEIVLFLGGSAKTYDSRDVFDRSWRNLPR